MDLASLRDAFARLAAWALRRAQEPSTWLGLAAAAGSAGYSVLGLNLTQASQIVPMILGAGGVAAAAASTPRA